MSASLVVDCSVAMAWLFSDEATPQTVKLLERLASETALVPGWWFLEVANVLALAERKGRISTAQSVDFISELSKLDIRSEADSAERAFDYLLPLCRTHQLTSYDAMYLDLAVRTGLPLATLDEPLRKAAKKMGVKLLAK
jgi:predicted nucleic acid-binding protein